MNTLLDTQHPTITCPGRAKGVGLDQRFPENHFVWTHPSTHPQTPPPATNQARRVHSTKHIPGTDLPDFVEAYLYDKVTKRMHKQPAHQQNVQK
mmetsp:Transcript_81256/g.143287  ORF Transcript_81256/g.143287 Transcript_81256/m.143287 type:complete len:94 (+) Transcript_81256:775-1056(+)